MNADERKAAGLIVGEAMREHRITYSELVEELASHGVETTERTIGNMKNGRHAPHAGLIQAALVAVDAIADRRKPGDEVMPGVPVSISRTVFLDAITSLGLDPSRLNSIECGADGIYVEVGIDAYPEHHHRVFIPIVGENGESA